METSRLLLRSNRPSRFNSLLAFRGSEQASFRAATVRKRFHGFPPISLTIGPYSRLHGPARIAPELALQGANRRMGDSSKHVLGP
jgi:hypothetical protein